MDNPQDVKKAEECEQMEAVCRLLISGQLSKLPTDLVPEGATVLHVAAILGYADCLHVLLQRKDIDINAKDHAGWTPLMHAAAHSHTAIIQILLANKNCDVNLCDNYQQTALHMTSQTRATDIAHLLIQHGASLNVDDSGDCSPFLRAIEANNQDMAKLLSSHGSVINTCNSSGRSALHMASQLGQEALILWLLQKRCNVNAPDNHFQTPLMLCVQQKKSSHLLMRLMKILIHAGTQLNLQDCHGNTVILLALSNAGVIKKYHIELLMKYGADPNIPNRDGLTPVWQAVYDGVHYPDRIKVIQILLQQNCYLDMSCRGKLLFTSGLNSVFCYENSMSPLEVAMDCGYYEAAKMLILAGCQIKTELRFDNQTGDVPVELQWFQSILETPQALQQQCRLLLRKVLGEAVQGNACKLPLPDRMKHYVLLHDLFQ